jgi:murein DD-endopeptidase MepM/ murein hydrolase activator NlpD
MWPTLLFLACVDPVEPTPEPRTVTVVRGDSLSRIARREGVTVDQLRAWNGLSADRIDVGQILIVDPAGAASVAPSPTPGPRRRPRPAAVPPDSDGPTVPVLARPAAKPCLDGPDGDALGEHGMATSQGLTAQGTRTTMDAFLPEVSSCLVGLDPAPTSALDLEITVACTGLVTSVTVQGSNDWPPAHADCLRKALRFASFPAHARPDGDSFLFPLRLQ